MNVGLTQETINAIKAIMVISPEVIRQFTTIELGENTLRVLNSISWQLKRLADAFDKEGEKKVETPTPAPGKNAVKARNASQPLWTPEEDKTLLELVEYFGPSWALIEKTKKLSGRTAASIGSRYAYLCGRPKNK